MAAGPNGLAPRHLGLGNISFTVCVPAGGLISAFATCGRSAVGLSAIETACLVHSPSCWARWRNPQCRRDCIRHRRH
jgi:hypothetical protein